MTDRPPLPAYGLYPYPAYPVSPDGDGDDDNLLRHYATVLRRRLRWVVMGAVIGLVAGVFAAAITTTRVDNTHYYKATNTLVPASGGVIGTQVPNSNDLLQRALLYAQSDELLTALGTRAGLSDEQLVRQLSAAPSANANLPAIDITAIATEPEQATQLADDAAAQIIELTSQNDANDKRRASLLVDIRDLQTREQNLNAQLQADPTNPLTAAALDDVRNKLSETQETLDSIPDNTAKLATLQPAMATRINAKGYNFRANRNINARSPLNSGGASNSGPDFDETDLSIAAPMSKTTRIALGTAAGLVLGLITAFLVEAWDDRIRRRETVETVTGVGVLSEIPHLPRSQTKEHHLAVADEPTSAVAERYRGARTAIQFALDEAESADAAERRARRGEGAAVVLVTSPSPNEGKTTTSANLATAFAEAGQRTLVIDADFRRPSIRQFLDPENLVTLEDGPSPTRVNGLLFQPGPHKADSPDEAITILKKMIPAARADYDIIVVDTPPILTTNDAADLLDVADEIVLVLRSGQTRKRAAKRVVELLTRFKVEPVGVVLNACERHEMDPYYAYGYGYYLRGGKKPDDGDTPDVGVVPGNPAGPGGAAARQPVPPAKTAAPVGSATTGPVVAPTSAETEPTVDDEVHHTNRPLQILKDLVDATVIEADGHAGTDEHANGNGHHRGAEPDETTRTPVAER